MIIVASWILIDKEINEASRIFQLCGRIILRENHCVIKKVEEVEPVLRKTLERRQNEEEP